MIDIHILPSVNATLNATAAVLLLTGYSLIRRKRIQAKSASSGAHSIDEKSSSRREKAPSRPLRSPGIEPGYLPSQGSTLSFVLRAQKKA